MVIGCAEIFKFIGEKSKQSIGEKANSGCARIFIASTETAGKTNSSLRA
jgi:hypothetical protein